MGIPSYFRRILRVWPACLRSSVQGTPDALCFDFNCLVYRCLHAPSLPPYTLETHDAWEEALLQEVKRTVKEVWVEAGRPPRVFIAVDGVVPMAKIRQQRMRRFKSAWLSADSNESGNPSWDPTSRAGREHPGGSATWDKNAITPGTRFMEKLTKALETLVSEHRGWSLSSVDQNGEGEHKVMNWLRTNSGLKSVVVYGLDADLILLSLITSAQTGIQISLLREKQEFGGPTTLDGVQQYQVLVLEELGKRAGIQPRDLKSVLNYVALMSLMGNDFLPHSLTHSLSDDGHECVVQAVRKGVQIIQETEGRWTINRESLLHLIQEWSTDEESRLVHMIQKKREQAMRGVGKGMEEREGLPLEWNVEECILPSRSRNRQVPKCLTPLRGVNTEALDGSALQCQLIAPLRGANNFGTGGNLVEGWKDLVWEWIHPSASQETCRDLCEKYLFGCQWILDYYTGQREVDLLWMFPAWLPPLWSDFAMVGNDPLQEAPIGAAPLKPEEQLAMVLPLASWDLVRDKKLRRLPVEFPQMWPLTFGFQSAGRKWLWQCEALVPVLTAERVRGFLETLQ